MITILGAGITGRSIARICEVNGVPYNLVGITPEVQNPGFFYVHQEIPGLTGEEITIKASVLGEHDREIYMAKSRPGEPVKVSSFDDLPCDWKGWKLLPTIWDLKTREKFVTKVDLEKGTYSIGEQTFEFTYLISTISLPIFMEICGLERKDLKFWSIPIWIKSNRNPSSHPCYANELLVYYDTTDSIWYRTTKSANGSVMHEISSEYWREDIIRKQGPDNSELYVPIGEYKLPRYMSGGDFKLLRPGKIFPDDSIKSKVGEIESCHDNVLLLGRYARWDYRMMLHNCVNKFNKFLNCNCRVF